MHLSPREHEKLMIVVAGDLARRRLEEGVVLQRRAAWEVALAGLEEARVADAGLQEAVADPRVVADRPGQLGHVAAGDLGLDPAWDLSDEQEKQVFFIRRSARDLLDMLDTMSGFDPRDSTSLEDCDGVANQAGRVRADFDAAIAQQDAGVCEGCEVGSQAFLRGERPNSPVNPEVVPRRVP